MKKSENKLPLTHILPEHELICHEHGERPRSAAGRWAALSSGTEAPWLAGRAGVQALPTGTTRAVPTGEAWKPHSKSSSLATSCMALSKWTLTLKWGK